MQFQCWIAVAITVTFLLDIPHLAKADESKLIDQISHYSGSDEVSLFMQPKHIQFVLVFLWQSITCTAMYCSVFKES